MGGIAKGLMEAPDRSGTILDRLLRLSRDAGLEVVLVGRHPAYASSAIEVLDDAALDSGPLSGLVSLLDHAKERDAIALATDMPHVERRLLDRLVREERDASVLAPRRDGFWEPLFARYRSPRVIEVARARLIARQLGLQGLLEASSATELMLDDEERAQLIDWDSPADVVRR